MMTRARRKILPAVLLIAAGAWMLACASEGGAADDQATGGTGATTGGGACPSAALVGATLELTGLKLIDSFNVLDTRTCDYGREANYSLATIIYRDTTPEEFEATWAPALQPGAERPVTRIEGLGDQAIYRTELGPSGPGTILSVLQGTTQIDITAPTELGPAEALARQLLATL